MCFIKAPKMDMPKAEQAVPPPPLPDKLQGVEFGGEDKEKDKGSGRKTLTIKRNPNVREKLASRQTRGVVQRNPAADDKNT